jgi:glycosyltransferase involved in cell wall biosynthesis
MRGCLEGISMRPEGSNVELTVVIPAHNSSDVIATCIGRLAERLSDRMAEVIIVENGSTDGTYELCLRLVDEWPATTMPRFRLLRSDKGMGNALRTGAEASRGEYVLLTADDLPFGFDDLDAFDRMAVAGTDRPIVMIGSKAHPDSRVNRGVLRGALTLGFSILRRLVLGMKTGDPQGTVIVEGQLLRSIAPTLHEHGFLFTTDLIYRLERMGVRPVEVPVALSADHARHASRVSPSDVRAMALGLFRLRRSGGPSSSDRGLSARSQSTPSAGTAEAGKDSPQGWPTRGDRAR